MNQEMDQPETVIPKDRRAYYKQYRETRVDKEAERQRLKAYYQVNKARILEKRLKAKADRIIDA